MTLAMLRKTQGEVEAGSEAFKEAREKHGFTKSSLPGCVAKIRSFWLGKYSDANTT